MKNLLVLFCVLAITSCKNRNSIELQANKDTAKNFLQLDVESAFEEKKNLYLSQIASKVEYIELETNEKCIIGRKPKFFFTDSLIFVSNADHILKYSRKGIFLGRIGQGGRGPGEIDAIRTLSVIPEKEILVVQKAGQRELLFFSFDGSFLKNASIPRLIEHFKVLNDGNYLAYDSGNSGTENYNFVLINEKRDTISVVLNNDKWGEYTSMSIMQEYPIFEPFYQYNDKYFFKSVYNDTIYTISENKIVPKYFINLGNFKLPLEFRPEKVGLKQDKLILSKLRECYYCSVLESSNNIFLTIQTFNLKDTKYISFEKNHWSGSLIINEDAKSTGFMNDIDGGLNFWPIGNVDDNHFYMPISIVDLKKILKNDKTDHVTKNPNSEKKLNAMISHLDISGNPILMIVTLKE